MKTTVLAYAQRTPAFLSGGVRFVSVNPGSRIYQLQDKQEV